MFWTSLWLLSLAPTIEGDIPPYFVKLIQDRTLFANDEAVILKIRLGNQSPRALKSRKFPDILASLTVTKGDEPMKMSANFSSEAFYKRLKSLDYGAHRDFRLNLARYFPAMAEGGVFKVRYKDKYYDLEGKSISIAAIPLPDVNALYEVDTSLGRFTIKLNPEQVPNHSRNFAILAGMQFYRNMVFHRVIQDFVVQTGDPLGTGQGGSGFPLGLEISPFLKHKKYALGMARRQEPDTASSQFYVCLTEIKELDNKYTIFGEVVDGFEVVEAIGNTPTNGQQGRPPNKPLEDVVLFSVNIQKPDN